MAEEQGIINTYILSLSDEVLLMVIDFLRTEDKFVLSKVCRRFDRILLDKKSCRDINISPKHDGSCLDYFGFYLQRRRTLIRSINITNCDWIPMPKIIQLTKGLSNLHSLHVMNISVPVLTLSEILKRSKQLRELSWSWRGDGKSKDITWSDVPLEGRSALSGLERLHICLPDPMAEAVLEFLLVFCSGLTHLTVQVDAALGKLPRLKGEKEQFCGPEKLQSLVAFHVLYDNYVDAYTTSVKSVELSFLTQQLWRRAGGFNRAWECLWIEPYSNKQWSDQKLVCYTSEFLSNLKSIVILSDEFAQIQCELPIISLVIKFQFFEERCNLSPLNLIAPKLQQLAILVKKPSNVLNAWVNSAIQESDNLVEINLFGVHYCSMLSSLENFWFAIKSLHTLKKLAVEPCVIPRSGRSTSNHWDGEKFIVSSSLNATEVNKDVSESLGLTFLEEFEVSQWYLKNETEQVLCDHNDWIPYIPVISIWTSLTCLTFDSISSLRSLYQFKLVAKACVNLSSLRFRCLGPKGHCGYVKDVAIALPYCRALKYFRLEQKYVSDFLKDLLIGLSECSQLEGICITNCNGAEKSHLKKWQNLQGIILKVINDCPALCFIQVPLPGATKKTCNKLKNWIIPKLSRPKGASVTMEFCSSLTIFGDTYHTLPSDVHRIEQMQLRSRVALTPPVN